MTDRLARISEEFREILAEEIPKLKDPRVGFVTVTRVMVSADLRRATVLYTVLGDDGARKATRAGLRSASGHLRTTVGREVRLKFLPELEFEEDQEIIQAHRLEDLLRQGSDGEGDEDGPPS